MADLLRIAVAGATGRMGLALVRALSTHTRLELVACGIRPGTHTLAVSHFEQAGLGFAKGMLTETPEALVRDADCVIDFTRPDYTLELARLVRGKALVSGTTGFTPAQKEALMDGARSANILWSSNMSVGVNLLMKLVEDAARALDSAQYDIEIVEAHHKHKIDAPSGTALSLGEAAARGRGVDLHDVWVRGRDGISAQRRAGDIGFAAIRGGDIVGSHDVLFAGEGEQITLSHHATDRKIFALGALKAAEWLAGKPNGFYTMKDVIR
jgi:4-hydroxy-tetrahydrodipicolinate reductase